jgi:hypothetical protein
MRKKINALSDGLLAEIRWAIAQVRRLVNAGSPQEHSEPPRAADGYIALTPADGIPARSGLYLYSAECEIFREYEVSTGVKVIDPITTDYDAPYKLLVYNPRCEAVPGDTYVTTDLTKAGTRYVDEVLVCGSSDSSSSDSSSDGPSSSGSSHTSKFNVFQSRCESGVLKVYEQTVTIDWNTQTLTKDSWRFWYVAGCCECGSDPPPSSSESSGSSGDPPPSESDGCGGTCQFIGLGERWILQSRNCNEAAPCQCQYPDTKPAYDDQIVYTDCGIQCGYCVYYWYANTSPPKWAQPGDADGQCNNGYPALPACEACPGAEIDMVETYGWPEGAYDGEVRLWPCGPESSSSDSSSSDSESSSGSGTCTGTCRWKAQDYGGYGQLYWLKIEECNEPSVCNCASPDSIPEYLDQLVDVPCVAGADVPCQRCDWWWNNYWVLLLDCQGVGCDCDPPESGSGRVWTDCYSV